jgi:hypothetical protein
MGINGAHTLTYSLPNISCQQLYNQLNLEVRWLPSLYVMHPGFFDNVQLTIAQDIN